MTGQPSLCTRCPDLEEEVVRLRSELAAVKQTMNTENTALGEELAGARATLRSVEAKLRAVQAELRKAREEDPQAERIKGRLQTWMVETGRAKNKRSRPNINVSGKRGQIVAKAMKLTNANTGEPYTDAELDMALMGLGLLPYVGKNGRKKLGTPDERWDEIEYALKDEVRIDKFIEHARNAATAAVSQSQQLWDAWLRIDALSDRYMRLALDARSAIQAGVKTDDLLGLLLRRDEESDAMWVEILSGQLHEESSSHLKAVA